MLRRMSLFNIGTFFLSWYLVFGFPLLDSGDLTTDVLAKPTFTFVAELQGVDDLKPVQPKSHPTAFGRWLKDGGKVSESVAFPRHVDHERHAVAPQYDLFLVFRV